MREPKSTIGYLKSCFELDNRGNLVSNVYSSKVSYRQFFKNGNFFTSWNELFLLENEHANNVQKELQLYVKEKELKVGLFFISFISNVIGKEIKNICPLFLVDAEIISDEFYFLRLQKDSAILNPAALKALDIESEDHMLEFKLKVEELIAESNGFSEGVVLQLRQLFIDFLPSVESDELLLYPQFCTQKKLKQFDPERCKIQVAGCMFVQEKSKNTQSVLSELDVLMRDNCEYSKLLLSYLNQTFIPKDISISPHQHIKTPVILSESQLKILSECVQNQCTIVTGPPGTGKSFTIAATAVNETLNGKSVLIVTGSEHANNAIEDKIKKDFQLTNISARISKNRSYKAELNRNLKKWLEGVGLTRGVGKKLLLSMEIEKLEDRLFQLETELLELAQEEIKFGEMILAEQRGLINKIKSFFLKLSLERIELHPKLMNEYFNTSSEVIRLKRMYLQAAQKEIIKNSIERNRQSFLQFRNALNATASGYIDELFKEIDFTMLTSVFPIWISTVSDVGIGLPFEKEMFDFVIVDEASQIDAATILPIFQRAKRVIICGDTEQLNPVTFIGQKQLLEVAEKFKAPDLAKLFNYQKESFLDICHKSLQDQSQMHFLDEHYRSLPDIISFSNYHFYNNELRIMTQLPKNENKIGLEPVFCNGTRLEDGTNLEEANALIERLKHLIDHIVLDDHLPTIGILSPFRKQANLIEKLIANDIELKDIKRHEIVCGTAHTFQGNERDIMLLSMVVDNHSHHGAFMHIDKSDVFNVSITRARNKQYVFHSLTNKCSHRDNLLFRYLFEPILLEDRNEQYLLDDLSLDKVTEWLKRSFKTEELKINYAIAGINIDIWAKINDRFVGIDAIGFPGEYEAAISVTKLKILSRLGIKIIPISVSNFLYHKQELKEILQRYI
ncbi:AAA domain-containing protein [Parvicella tangerina]|uniref:ATP-dependent RecD-like DNA helicase n=1 Tax=Parvicella tangerina TaxID=2829795 RepID=A0A916NHK8_9FLAO|nr:AAA domain-containing protein [Parvicella tangerina]CAG5083290.1 ATP-dependent RecD-like DNA helicase [Parvicella tangerina]